MDNTAQVMSLHTPEGQAELKGWARPVVNEKTGEVYFKRRNGMIINSALRKDEWEELDNAIVQAAVQPLRITPILEQRGLVRRLGSIGTMTAQYNRVSEMTAANISLSGHASGEKDLVDYALAGVPVPVIFKEFELDERYLASSRMLGDGIDTSNARAAARVVSEKVEDLIINGDSSINLNGATIAGITNEANVNTDTATNYGGGDWGTIGNIETTIAGMISAAQADGYYGPYGIFASTTQYNQAALTFFTDGSGQTPLQRIMNGMPNVAFFEQTDNLADGTIALVHLSSDVVEIAYVPMFWPITNLEWSSGDGMLNQFKVMTVFTVIVKSDHSGRSGIVIATGA